MWVASHPDTASSGTPWSERTGRYGWSRCSEIRIGQRVEVRAGRVPQHVEDHAALKSGPGLPYGEVVADLSGGRNRLSAERGKYLGAKRDELRPKPAKTARPKKERGRKMLRRLAASDASHAGNTSSNLVGVTRIPRFRIPVSVGLIRVAHPLRPRTPPPDPLRRTQSATPTRYTDQRKMQAPDPGRVAIPTFDLPPSPALEPPAPPFPPAPPAPDAPPVACPPLSPIAAMVTGPRLHGGRITTPTPAPTPDVVV